MLSFAGCRDAGGAGTKRPAAMDDGRADEDGPRPAAKKQNHGGRLTKLSKNECAAGDAMDTDAAVGLDRKARQKLRSKRDRQRKRRH